MPNLVELIKQAAEEAREAGEPTNIVYGTVTSVSPLAIMVDQKLTLSADFLVLTKNVMDYQTSITLSLDTENAEGHKHGISGTAKATIHNGLRNGDKVMMIKQAGGQSYVVIDRIGGMI